MLGNHKLIIDTHCEVYGIIKSHADGIFWNFLEHVEQGKLEPDAVYIIGREQLRLNSNLVRQLVEEQNLKLIFSNPAEGSDTLRAHCKVYGITNLALRHKILLIGGGEMEPRYPYMLYDSFLPKLYDYTENVAAAARTDEIFAKKQKPYKFLFLNGRGRPHREALLTKFINSGLITQSLWSNLDHYPNSKFVPINYLPPEYEVDRYREQISVPNTSNRDLTAKHHLFRDEWGEVYLQATSYIDTYFSLVTETVFTYPHSFRTEKIYKPIAMGHPFIAVANAGYYRDLHHMGFRTFGHVIDESFDQIDNNSDRLVRVTQVVEDLCQQDLAKFMQECYNVCKYNQQHMAELRPKIRQEFPDRLHQFINERFNI